MSTKKFRPDVDAPVYKGGYSPYDIIKEGTIAIVVVGILVVLLAVVFGSPDEPAITIKKWSNAAPIDFATTALSELNGTSISASYGAPYNHNGPGQQLGPLALARWVGVRIPINSADDFVIDPLQSQPNNPALRTSLTAWETASASTRSSWVANYTKVAGHMTFTNGNVEVPATNAGPVPVIINDLTHMARTGALDTALLSGNGFFTTDYTKPLLFIADGSYLGDLAQKQHMLGNQWGMMNETGSYPGQPWLWLYTFWYQVPPMNSSTNGDIEVFAIMILLTLVLFFLPLIPGLRAIPRKVRLYRVIWREHYRDA